jgi:RNA polymerase sigma factor (sigma-70 family)
VKPSTDSEFEPAHFTGTHWSLVLNAAEADATKAKNALEELCHIYWPAIYGYLRRKSYSAHDAQDLTQEFFERLLRRNTISKADPTRGRFRTFLLRDLNFMLMDSIRRDFRQKRGSGEAPISLSAMEAEEMTHFEPASEGPTPEEWYDRRWRVALLQRALNRLRTEFEEAGKAAFYAELREFLVGEAAQGAYDAVAARLEVSSGSIAVTVHRMRARFRELVRLEVSQTVGSEPELDEELRALLL